MIIDVVIERVPDKAKLQAIEAYRVLTGQSEEDSLKAVESHLPILIQHVSEKDFSDYIDPLIENDCDILDYSDYIANGGNKYVLYKSNPNKESALQDAGEDKTTQKLKKWVCSRCGYMTEGVNPPPKCPICASMAKDFAEKKSENSTNHLESNHGGAKKGESSESREDRIIDDIGVLPRDEILTVLHKTNETQINWRRAIAVEEEAIQFLNSQKEKLKTIRDKRNKLVEVLFAVLIGVFGSLGYGILGESMIGAIAGGIVGFFIASKATEGKRQSFNEKKAAEAEEFNNQCVIPAEQRLEEASRQLKEFTSSGELEKAVDIVGTDIFENGNVSDIIELISSRRV